MVWRRAVRRPTRVVLSDMHFGHNLASWPCLTDFWILPTLSRHGRMRPRKVETESRLTPEVTWPVVRIYIVATSGTEGETEHG